MNILFRVDSATHIGTGHVMRCLTLANALSKQGAKCQFVCRAFNGHLAQTIKEAGHIIHLLPCNQDATFSSPNPQHAPPHCNWLDASWEDDFEQTKKQLENQVFDWLVIDHYALDNCWEKQARVFAKKIMVIDDLADRKHDCELLLDQNLGRQTYDYQNVVPNHCQLLIGPQYALLRPEFAQWREYSLKRRQEPELKTVLISLGGTDSNNVTGQVLEALHSAKLPKDIKVNVIMGQAAPYLSDVKKQAKTLPWQTQVLVNVSNMAELMANADVAIGAAGSSSWERCCLGLPTVMLELADNQKCIAKALVNVKAALSIELNSFNIPSYEEFAGLTENSSTLCDGMGVSKVMSTLTKLSHHK